MKYSIYFILILLYSCATVGNLGGGPVDEKPPILLDTSIKDLNFNSKEIVLEFDEYITLNNATKNIFILPRHSTLKSKISGKKLIIHFDSTLYENTTYNLVIDKGIQDYNANNTYSFQTTFSTGPYKDTNTITVKIPGFSLYKSLKIGLTETQNIDSFKTFKSDYIYEVNKELYVFGGLNAKKRHIWLFTDEDDNNIPDINKPIDFILNAEVDSIYNLNPNIWMKPFTILKIKQDTSYTKIYHTPNRNHRYNIHTLIGVKQTDIVYSTSDSTVIYKSELVFNTRIDTVRKINAIKEAQALLLNSIKIYRLQKSYSIYFNVPQIYSSKNSNNSQRIINTSIKQDSLVLTQYKTSVSDTIYIKDVLIEEINKLSYLKISLTDSTQSIFDVKIIKDGKIIKSYYGVNTIEDYIEPGIYTILIYPLNYESEFNPFEGDKMSLPIYEKTLYLKASWEEILEVKL